MSDDLISRRALYERAATLEAQALDYVGKLIERDGDEYSTEWKIWSAILAERTAFKHDVFDAPSAQRTGRWIIKEIPGIEWYRVTCSACGEDVSSVVPTIGFFPNVKALWDFCPECGARMEEQE